MFNVPGLKEAIDAAGLPFDVDSAGNLYPYDPQTVTPEQTQAAQAIVAAHNPAVLSKQQEIDQARAAIAQGKAYLQKQLVSVSPHTLTQLVSNMKPVVDGNTYLLRMVENKIDVMSVAFGWTAADIKAPDTAIERARYVEAVMQIIALLA